MPPASGSASQTSSGQRTMGEWLVYLAVPEGDVEAVREAAAEVLDPYKYGIVTELLEGAEEAATQLALTVVAGSVSGAFSVAGGEWARVRAVAGVPKAAAHVDFLVGPVDQPAPFHEQLLLRAAQLVPKGEPSYALVTAVSAFEVYERQAIRDMAARDMPGELVENLCALYKRVNRTQQQRFLEDLLGKKLQEAGKAWIDYKSALRSRQAIVHEGGVIDDAGATEALTAVRNLIGWVERAVQSRA